jgi:hypothetical protein
VQRAYLLSTRFFSVLLVAIGLAMIGAALARGGGPAAVGVVLGVLFACVGAGRLWLARGGAR